MGDGPYELSNALNMRNVLGDGPYMLSGEGAPSGCDAMSGRDAVGGVGPRRLWRSGK